MKKLLRILSAFTACCIPLSFTGITADALGALPQKNTVARHLVCSELSDEAEAYYSGSYSYDNISALDGAEDCSTSYEAMQDNPLFDSLHTLMANTHEYFTSYPGYKTGSLAYFWQSTDSIADSDSYVMFYSDVPFANGVTMNREHIWPKSRASFYQTNGGSDLHHLRPAVDSLNNAKSNHAFGEVDGVFESGTTEGTINGEVVYYLNAKQDLFECKDDVKGDVARILLYVYCRWEQPNLYTDMTDNLPAFDADDDANSGDKVIESLDTLLSWCELDPVDTWEMKRNDLTQEVQGNRNVFIDYPELAWQLFGMEPPKGMQTPTSQGCRHNYVLDRHVDPTCEQNGADIYRCSLCGNEKSTPLPALGHIDENEDDLCDRCGAELVIFAGMERASTLNDGEHLILYHPSTTKTFGDDPDGKGHLTAVPAKVKNGVINPSEDCAAFSVRFEDNNSFYLIRKGKYLTTAATGGSLGYEDEPNTYSLWQLTPSTVNGQFFIDSVNAINGDKPQRLQIYYGYCNAANANTTPAYRFELYTTSDHCWKEDSDHYTCRLCGKDIGKPILGDVNNDGEVNINDVTAVQRYLAQIQAIASPLSADINDDGTITIDDATLIQFYLAKREVLHPIGDHMSIVLN